MPVEINILQPLCVKFVSHQAHIKKGVPVRPAYSRFIPVEANIDMIQVANIIFSLGPMYGVSYTKK